MRFIALSLFLSLLLVGCRQTSVQPTRSELDIQLQIEPETVQVGAATLRIQVNHADGSPIEDATLTVRGDMTHAGMVPVIREVRGGIDGEYEVPFEWTMAGDWFIEIMVTMPDGSTAMQRFEVDGVQES